MTKKEPKMGTHRRAILEEELKEHGKWDGKTHFIIIVTTDTGSFHQNAAKATKVVFIVQANSPLHAELRLKKEVAIGDRDEIIIKPATVENLLALFTFTDHVIQVVTVE